MVALVLGARRYKFPAKDTGEIIEGAKVTYVNLGIKPRHPDDQFGYEPMVANMPYEAFAQFNRGPGHYEIQFDVQPGAGGVAKAVLVGAKFLGPVNLEPQKVGS